MRIFAVILLALSLACCKSAKKEINCTNIVLNKDNFYLLGHSRGGILALEYAEKYAGTFIPSAPPPH